MAQPQRDPIDAIFKALRLVPEFDGNPNILTRFISLRDELVRRFLNPQPGHELENQSLLNGILNKVTGNAARLINTNGIPTDWNGIRTALINNFADQRDETALYLSLLTQGHSTPQEFYERCQNLFSIIMTYVSLHDNLPSTIEAKRALYKKLTFQSYLRGLKEPLGSRIRCMRPESIEKALEYVQEETNTLYLQQRNDNFLEKKQPSNSPAGFQYRLQNNPPVSISSHKPINYAMPMSMPSPSRQLPIQSHQPWRPNNMNVHQPVRGPSRTQQMFRALPPNYSPRGNAFNFPPRNVQSGPVPQKPAPMSGVSHFVSKPMPRAHDWARSGNPPPSNYFKSRELNFNECPDYEYGPYYEHYTESYFNEPEFHDYYHTHADNGYYDQSYYNDMSLTDIEPSESSNPLVHEEDFCKDPKSDKPK